MAAAEHKIPSPYSCTNCNDEALIFILYDSSIRVMARIFMLGYSLLDYLLDLV